MLHHVIVILPAAVVYQEYPEAVIQLEAKAPGSQRLLIDCVDPKFKAGSAVHLVGF